MKWTLLVLVLGVSPVKTGMVFNTLDECLSAEDSMRSEYASSFNKWIAWARANPKDSGFPDSQDFMKERIGLKNYGTCIPYGQISD